MPIDFLDLLAEDGWAPVGRVPEGAGDTWADGGTLDEAPVDVASTFGGVRRSTSIDDTFGLHGVRLPAGFEGPERCHDQPILMIVFGGSIVVRSQPDDDADGAADGGREEHVGVGRFCVIDEGTVHSVSAGADGATYTECWPHDADGAATTWLPGPAWVDDRSAGAAS